MKGEQAIIEGLRRRVAKLGGLVESLSAELEALREENRSLREENRSLGEENGLLRGQLEQALRANARQAAPFRRREKAKKPEGEKKQPGREAGHPGTCRSTPEQVDQEIEVPLDRCPKCGGEISACQRIEQFIEEIPPVRPRVFRVVTWQAQCKHCGDVFSTHPLQTSRGERAAKNQLGPRALAIAVTLNKYFGLSMRKTCRLLGKLFGLRFTPGGLSQAADRVADRLAGHYDTLIADIRGSPAVFADETSWWVGGPGWWLWTFTTPQETVYHVDQSRGSAVVKEVLGEDYPGMLVSDCLASYDPIDCRKHKCIAHHLRAIGEARELPGQVAASRYLRQWEVLLQTVISFHRLAVEGCIDAETLAKRRCHLEAWADTLLAQAVEGPGEARIRNRLAKQRPHLLGCLYELSAEPTNNRAERSLRPAVIARKLSCGNKTVRGRHTWQVLASLATTCQQRGQDIIDHLATRIPLAAHPQYAG
jgi:transposase/regulator of replication initiation timing